MTFDQLSAILLSWPLVEPGTSYGTPAFKVKGKLLTRLQEDGDTLVVKAVEPDERDMLIAQRPDVYYCTDHYRSWPIVLVRLSRVEEDAIVALLKREYARLLPKRALRALDTDRTG